MATAIPLTHPARCFSSLAMTELLAWRNASGREEEWAGRWVEQIDDIGFAKALLAEIALPFITVAAAVETVVYAILAFVSALFSSDDMEAYFLKLLFSSAFTVLWSANSLVFENLSEPDLLTQEAFASISFGYTGGSEDQNYRFSFVATHPDFLRGNNPQLIPLRDPNVELRALEIALLVPIMRMVPKSFFDDSDPNIYPFVLARCMVPFLIGERKAEPLPSFFKATTSRKILAHRQPGSGFQQALRAIEQDPLLKARLLEILEFRLDVFQELNLEDEEPSVKLVINALKGLSHEELYGSVLIRNSWAVAQQQVVNERLSAVG